jgi:hypothetical protein
MEDRQNYNKREWAMPNVYVEIAQIFAPIVGVIVGLIGGDFVKSWDYKRQERQENDKLWLTQKQSRWSPLLRATREIKDRFEALVKIYYGKTNTILTCESLRRDFCELYLLLSEREINEKIYDFQGGYWSHLFDCDPNAPRKDENLVQHVRMRTYSELTFAESSLYKTVEYLGNAEHVWSDLYENRFILPEEAKKEMKHVIWDVRESLQGKQGSGIFIEQQEYIGEAVWSTADCVIANHEFLNKLFGLQSWEQFTKLFRFFVDLEFKLEYEIKDTISALGRLEEKVNQLCSCQNRREYEALWTRGTFMQFLRIQR